MRWLRLIVVGALALGAGAWVGPRPLPAPSPQALPGWRLYDRLCLACHGAAGDGRGPAAPYTWGRPRDLTTGVLRWRTTPIGSSPTDDDLRLTLAHGAPGTSMPGFAATLTPAELDQLVAVVRAFAPAPAPDAPVRIGLGPAPGPDPARGAARWIDLGCVACHGATGAGDGPAAASLAPRPYDLRTTPLRRPRARDDHDGRREAIALSVATGLAGTAMPGYAGIPEADLWALADHVLALGAARAPGARADRSRHDDEAIAADRGPGRVEVGAWPGHGAPDEAVVWGAAIAPQGPPPPGLPPAQASLSAQQCARCHAKQLREWQGSLHAGAASPGLIAQIDHALPAAEAASCRRCHAPLAEQATDVALRAEGLSCAGCHVRAWTRHGPAGVAASLLALPGYPRAELALYERGDFCLPCHQLPPRSAVAGKPLLNTYKEWLEGPYMRRGVQCQHCHMPNREHTFLGVHDPATFRQGYALTARAHRTGGVVTVAATLANVGAGHYLPTTPTPAAFLRVELVDATGAAIPGARAELRIGRDIWFDGRWHERADTRIPPGAEARLARAWQGGATRAATHARLTVEVHPDAFYEGLYATRLRGRQTATARALTQQALATARGRRYVAETRLVPIAAAAR